MADDPRYNWIYKELVKGPNDVSGALAYVLYKNDKIAYIESFAKEHERQPERDDLKEFTRMTNLPGALDAYRERADFLLEGFLDNVLAEQLTQLRQQVHDDAVVNAVKRSWLRGVSENLVAGLVTSLITFGFILAVWMYNEGPAKILTGVAKKMLGDESPSILQKPSEN